MGLLDTTETEPKIDTKNTWNEECAWRQDGFVLHAKIEYDDYHNQEGPAELGSFWHKDGKDAPPEDELVEIRTREGPAWWHPNRDNYKGEPKAEADKYVAQDVERVRGFYLDEWAYHAVCVTAYFQGIELAQDRLHGIESDAGDYHLDVILECAAEAIHRAKKERVKITVGEDPWHNDTVQFARIMSELNGGGYGLDYAAMGERVGLTELEVSQLFGRADEVWDAAEKKMCESVVARCGVTA